MTVEEKESKNQSIDKKLKNIRSKICDIGLIADREIIENFIDEVLDKNGNVGLHYEVFTEDLLSLGFWTGTQNPSVKVKEPFQTRNRPEKKYVSVGKGIWQRYDPDNPVETVGEAKKVHKRKGYSVEKTEVPTDDSLLDKVSTEDKESIRKRERFPVGVLPWKDRDGNIIPDEVMKEKYAVVYEFVCDQFEDGKHTHYIGSKIGNFKNYGGSGVLWRTKLKEFWETTGNVPIIERRLISEHSDKDEVWDAEEALLEKVDAANSDKYANKTNKARRFNSKDKGDATTDSSNTRGPDRMLVIQVPESGVVKTPESILSCEDVALAYLRRKKRKVHKHEIGGMLYDLGYFMECENRSPEVCTAAIEVAVKDDKRFKDVGNGFYEANENPTITWDDIKPYFESQGLELVIDGPIH